MFRISKRGIGYYRLVSEKDDFYVSVKHGEKGYEDDSVKHGEKGYEDDDHIHEVAMMLCDYLNDTATQDYPVEEKAADTKIKDEPYYYANDGLSPIGAFKQGLISMTELIGFYKANVIKYVVRFQSKGNPAQDLHKARDYIDFLLDIYEG